MIERKRIVVGVTGASGAAYAKRLLKCLIDADAEVYAIFSPWGQRLFADELGITHIDAETLIGRATDRLTICPHRNVGSEICSGTFSTDGMIICPCSSHTLGAMAAGLGDNAIVRSAAVTLKEGRSLILVHREMPVTQIDLRNLLRLSKAGATICPASPGFYMVPRRIEDLIDFVVGKLLDLVAIPHELDTRWADMLERTDSASSKR